MSYSSRTFLLARMEELRETNHLDNPFDLFYTEEREKQIGKRTCLSCKEDVTLTGKHKCNEKDIEF